MKDQEPDWAEQRAAEMLPCSDYCICVDKHYDPCPAFYRPAVAQVLREAATAAEHRGYERGVEAAKQIVDTYSGIQTARIQIRALTTKEPSK